jgi:hypothetical protein
MKTAYVNDLGIVDVPFNTLREGEVVLVKSTSGSEIHRLLVGTEGNCSDCPYRSTTDTRFSCGARWSDGLPPHELMKPLCAPSMQDHKMFIFKDLDNIMEDL